MRWIPNDGKEALLSYSVDSHTIQSLLIDERGCVCAWVTHPDDWYWAKFDDAPMSGPFESEAAAKLAAELLFNKPS